MITDVGDGGGGEGLITQPVPIDTISITITAIDGLIIHGSYK